MNDLKKAIATAILDIRKRVQNDKETQDDIELLELYCLLDITGAMPDYAICLLKQGKEEQALKYLKEAHEKGNGYINFLVSGVYAALGDDYIDESMNALKKSANLGFELSKSMLDYMSLHPYVKTPLAEA